MPHLRPASVAAAVALAAEPVAAPASKWETVRMMFDVRVAVDVLLLAASTALAARVAVEPEGGALCITSVYKMF